MCRGCPPAAQQSHRQAAKARLRRGRGHEAARGQHLARGSHRCRDRWRASELDFNAYALDIPQDEQVRFGAGMGTPEIGSPRAASLRRRIPPLIGPCQVAPHLGWVKVTMKNRMGHPRFRGWCPGRGGVARTPVPAMIAGRRADASHDRWPLASTAVRRTSVRAVVRGRLQRPARVQ